MLLDRTAAAPDEIVLRDDLGETRTRAELLDRATRIGRLLHDELDVPTEDPPSTVIKKLPPRVRKSKPALER